MSKISFIAERGNPGADGLAIDLVGIRLPERPVKLLANFNTSELVGFCKVSIVPNGLLVETEVPEQLLDAYPAIGYHVLESKPDELGGHAITACTLQAVSLSATPNVDPAIKTIREQLTH
jgi:hypothetical protein